MTDLTPGYGSNSEARKREVERANLAEDHCDRLEALANKHYAAFCGAEVELAQVKAELDRLRAGIAALLADGPDTWTGYDSRDTGHTFLADSVLDFTAELRQLLGGHGPDVRDDLMREWER